MNAKTAAKLSIPMQMREDCSIKKSMDIIGDRWSVLILREMFLGTNRFADFQRNLGIAKNILSARLQKLEEHRIIEKRPINAETSWNEYLPTEAGEDLLTVLCALIQWGDRWLQDDKAPPMLVVDRQSRKPIDGLMVTRKKRPLKREDIRFWPSARYKTFEQQEAEQYL
ncbi:MAG: helix-turn-helix domain-containing protein [Parvibaculaceae bacterium]|nr:helix-turn-helix domain-containing protein [Parvibaculaceae bacterium]